MILIILADMVDYGTDDSGKELCPMAAVEFLHVYNQHRKEDTKGSVMYNVCGTSPPWPFKTKAEGKGWSLGKDGSSPTPKEGPRYRYDTRGLAGD